MRTTLLLAFSLTLILPMFQNCGRVFTGFSESEEASLALPLEHPSIERETKTAVAKGELRMGDRDFIESVFLDVFSSGDPGAQGFLEAVLYQELAVNQHVLGRSCEPAEDGSSHDCAGAMPNMDLPMDPKTSSIREAVRIQTCRRLLANDTMLGIVIQKTKGPGPAPDAASIEKAIRLFYPAQDSAQEAARMIMKMDEQIARDGNNDYDRWRAVLLILCESPTWQML